MIMVYCFCFSQETAYEMRNSDWSSDVCSSDLPGAARAPVSGGARGGRRVSPPSAACMAAPLAPSAHQGGDGLDRGAPRRHEGFARKNRGKCSSAERSGGQECVCKFRSTWSPYHYKKTNIKSSDITNNKE